MLRNWLRKRNTIKLASQRGRSKQSFSCQPFRFRPAVEFLEDRTVLSAFYDLTSVASTASGAFSGFGDLISVNASGDTAFVGSTSTGNGIFVVPSGSLAPPTNINPATSSDPLKDYGRGVAINEKGQVAARERRAVDVTRFAVRIWDSTKSDSFTTLASVPDTSPYSAIQTFTAINDFGVAAYVTQSSDSAYRQVQLWRDGQAKVIEEMPGAGQPSPRPVLTALGEVVYYSTRDKAIKINNGFGKSTIIASPAIGGVQKPGDCTGSQ
ncbi:hypothetical protein BH10PLA2_BH10PLA2_33360 [soil metagenome]